MTSADRFDLERFVTAQAPVFETVLAELRAGRKRTHWMWFVFPQLSGLGRSSTARFYGIGSIDEARAYLAHPVLGPRLDLCARIVLASESPSLHAIFGSPDAGVPGSLRFRVRGNCWSMAGRSSGCLSIASCSKISATIRFWIRQSRSLENGGRDVRGRGQGGTPSP
jgi:uncharacterized protein (DUF1810 family)